MKSKSKKAFGKNVESEMESGKSQPQSLAIAYSVQKQAKKKKYSKGGMVYDGHLDEQKPHSTNVKDGTPSDRYMSEATPPRITHQDGMPYDGHMDEEDPVSYADGGMVESPTTIAEAIRRKQHIKTEGQVDLEANSEESPNYYDPLDAYVANRPQYDDSQISPQPMDSNEHGDDIESDVHDMISKIRAKYRSKRG